MSRWTLAGAFDAGQIRGGSPGWEQELDFHQLALTGHAEQLEADYRLFREEFGLRQFRDGAWLDRAFPAPGRWDWSYLDRLATVSRGEVTLSLCHYEWPRWATEYDLASGRIVEAMATYAGRVAERYRVSFASYIPVVECGYWTAMMSDWRRWWPAAGAEGKAHRWWAVYAVVGRMLVATARAVRAADPEATIALSEPWAWHPQVSLADQGRPFDTLLGRPDPVAVRETGEDGWGGDPSLLDVAGLNFYNNWGQPEGWLGETGNCHFADRHTVPDWLRLIADQVDAANAQGAAVEGVTWAPVLTLGDFDWGQPAPGAWVTWEVDDPRRRRRWNAALARTIRAFVGQG
jgi:hypothetical protein